ncbi:MAG TPA: MFS transporter [Dongiaceae bacterium]|nr:MFS transporter [Dongiaceae bacterium]
MLISREPITVKPVRGNRTAIIAWCLFDWGNSAFPTIIVTFLFSAYFTKAVAPNPELGTALWGQVNSVMALVAAFLAPLLGAIADQGGRRKPWLLALSLICILGTASLWFVRPDPSSMSFALVMFAIAGLGFELGLVFYNAMLPELAPSDSVGRISGWGWGVGYLGGLACLIICLLLFVQPDPALFGLDRASAEHVRITNPFSAAWFVLFALPLFLLVPDQSGTGLPWSQAVRRGLRTLADTFRQLRAHRNIAIFLLGKMIYIDGLNTLFAFGGIYAAGTFGMSFDEILLFAIALNVSSGLGAIGFAWIDDWVGAKPTILVALAAMTMLGAAILFVDSEGAFIALAVGLGLFFGPAQASSRSLMSRLAPPESRAEFFGLFALAGRITAFLGPAFVGWVTFAAQSQRAGMATILPFFVVGGLLLLFVKEPRVGRQSRSVAT